MISGFRTQHSVEAKEYRGIPKFYLENRNIIANFVAEDFGGSLCGFHRRL